ncbi:MAG: hypothetical protein ACI4MJ_08215 [Aristaeellaceae bacterium]
MKKMFSMLLALLMLVLPVLGCAATTAEMVENAGLPLQTTVTMQAADLSALLGEEMGAICADVINALGLEIYQADGRADVSVKLSGADALTLQCEGKDDTFYLSSNLLGKRVAAVAADEWQPLMERVLDLLVAAEALDQAEADTIKEQFGSMMNGGAVGGMLSAAEAFEDVDWTPLVKLIAGVEAKTEAATEQPADCDKAMTKMTVTMTSEYVAKFYATIADCLRTSEKGMAFLDAQLAGTGMTAEEMLTQMVSTMEQAVQSMEPVTITGYASLTGVVAMDIPMTMAVEDETVAVPFTYRRLTTEAGVSHTASMPWTLNGENLLNMTLNYVDGDITDTLAFAWTMEPDEDNKLLLTVNAVFDEQHVNADASMDFTADGDTMNLALTLTSAQEDNKANLALNLNLQNNGMPATVVALTMDSEETPGDVTAQSKGNLSLAVTMSGATMGLKGSTATTAQTEDSKVRSETVADIAILLMNQELPVLTVNAVTESCDAKASLAEGTTVHPATLTDEELTAYSEEIMEAVQTALMLAMQNLPTSVLMMMMGQ